MRRPTLGPIVAFLFSAVVAPQRAVAQQLPDLDSSVVISLPSGYGHYCSVVSDTGQWDFQFGDGSTDPCGDILGQMSGTIVRAGIFSLAGENNVMVRCGARGPNPYRVRGTGTTILQAAKSDNLANSNCLFVVAPTSLAMFGHPWLPQFPYADPDVGVGSPTGFNYDVFGSIVSGAAYSGGAIPDSRVLWDVGVFGQTPSPANTNVTFAIAVDRHGIEQEHSGDSGECLLGVPYCVRNSNTHRAFESAYDWSMELGRPLIAVAPGVIRGARMRNVQGLGCQTPTQGEIFIESQVDVGTYAEHFVAAYHHMDSVNKPGTQSAWPNGALVQRGDLIAYVGNSGCSGAPHLDLSVFRLTNLTGVRSYAFQALPVNPTDPPTNTTKEGVNGWQGIIDPFGWAAPSGIDPYSYSFIGFDDPQYPKSNIFGLTEPGAFSINLWIPGVSPNQPPPTY